jgi:hypothetical protein
MNLPDSSDSIWKDLITGKKAISFDFLAIKIFLGSAQRMYAINPQTLNSSSQNLHSLFFKNNFLPTVKKDILKFSEQEIK